MPDNKKLLTDLNGQIFFCVKSAIFGAFLVKKMTGVQKKI